MGDSNPLRIQFKLLGAIVYSHCLGVSNRFSISLAGFLRILALYTLRYYAPPCPDQVYARFVSSRLPMAEADIRLRMVEFNSGDQGALIRVALNFPDLEGVALGSDGS